MAIAEPGALPDDMSMGAEGHLPESREGSFERVAALTAKLASTPCLDEIAGAVGPEIAALGFGMVWMAKFDESTGHLLTVKEFIDGRDSTVGSPAVLLDARRPIGRGFHLRRMINIRDPDQLYILDEESEPVPPGMLALPRLMYRHLRGSPFACGPLLGSAGQPVGAIGLSSFRGRQPIPDDLFERGLLRTLADHLAIATERALLSARLERMQADLMKVQEAMSRDARLKAVGELAGSVAHDIRNLSGISLLAASAGLRSPDSVRDVLRPIERANRAIGDLMARLQRVSRAAASGPGEAETAEPAEIVQDILLMLAPVLREHSIAVELELGIVPPVRVDPAILHQVVLNLVLNARDALEAVSPDRRRVHISARQGEDGIRIVVADTGPGIAPEARARIFQPFVTTKGSDHLGLGLAAARAALERHGGQLTASNQPSGGARFEVKLERARRRYPDATPTELPSAKEVLAATSTEVLVVDDDKDLVDVVRAFLAPIGFRVTTATSVPRALELAGREAFSLVLCDIGMPRHGGIDLCRELRRLGFGGKILLMTGWDSEAAEADLPEEERHRILTKPFSGSELLEAIETELRG